MAEKFDAVVIGGGPGGYVCAIRMAQLGFKVACVEMRSTLGGTCLNVGCIPSKALLESSHLYSKAQHEFADHGIDVGKTGFQLDKMLSRKDKVVDGMTSGIDYLMKKNKITRIDGRGKILTPGKVQVGDREILTDRIVIATGSAPIEIPIAKFDQKTIVDSTDALAFEKVPKHLVVIGGGVIGLELGSVWKRLGAEVTVVEAMDRIVPTMDKAISAGLLKSLKKQGLKFEIGVKLTSTKVSKNKVKLVCVKKDGSELELEADKLLVAVGRKAYTDGLGLENVGIALDERGRVPVDAHLQTSVAGIFAIGDVIAGPMLAHKAEEEGVALAEFIANKAGHVNYQAIPSVVYTWPEIAAVGLTEEEAKEQGYAIKTGKFLFKANGRAKAMHDDDGFVKVIGCAKTDRLLGCHIIGPCASELIGEIVMAFEYGASVEDVARTIHAHPTLLEAVKEAALDVHGEAIHA